MAFINKIQSIATSFSQRCRSGRFLFFEIGNGIYVYKNAQSGEQSITYSWGLDKGIT